MINKDEEEVLVVKTNILFPDGVWEGFREIPFEKVKSIIEKNRKYLKRRFAETDNTWQQIIPQIALISNNKIFIHRISQSGNEDRLFDLWPIFLGGHINNFDSGIKKATEREFKEEINYEGKIVKKTFLGMVKINNPLVNAVHTGIVWLFEGDSENFSVTDDTGLIDGKFIKISELNKYMDKMTYWSKLVAPYLMKRFRLA